MPSWGIHLATAKKLQEKLQIETNDFLLGNILPDINNGYVMEGISCLKTYQETHYFELQDLNGQKEWLPNLQSFIQDNQKKIKHPIVLGYYTHLLADYYWNKLTYLQYGILNNNKERIGIRKNTGENFICDKETARKMKVNDFNSYSKWLYQENKVQNPIIQEEQLKEIQIIKTVSLTKEDLKKVKEYLKKEEIQNKKEKSEQNYQIYTKEEMNKQFENSILFIQKEIEKIFS